MAGGYPLTIPLHVANGAYPGRTMLLLAAIHGEEIFAVDVIREVLRRVDRAELRGAILAIPVGNPPSLEWRTRNTPIDMLNMNRIFPGKASGWLSEQMAAVISDVVKTADVVIDLDGGSSERVIHYTYIKDDPGTWGQEVETLSKIFGLELLYRGPFFEGSVSSYCQELSISCIVPEVGGSLLFQDPRFLEEAVKGVLNVLRYVEMLPGRPELPDFQYLLTRRTLVRCPQGGIFHPDVALAELNRPLPAGKLLGRIIDPYALGEAARITAPWDDAVILQMRVLTCSFSLKKDQGFSLKRFHLPERSSPHSKPGMGGGDDLIGSVDHHPSPPCTRTLDQCDRPSTEPRS